MGYEEFAKVAIETVREALEFFRIGNPLVRKGPRGEVHIDVPLMYYDFAIDRMHFDPYINSISPKGRPVMAVGVKIAEEVLKRCKTVLKRTSRSRRRGISRA